jgi:hypothetical protein
VTKWHEFKVGDRTLAFSWDGYRVESFRGSATFVEDDESYARESMKRSFDGYDPELLARDLKALAIPICDAVGASPEYRAAVLATIEADAEYNRKVVSREPTPEEAAVIAKLLPVLAALAGNDDVRIFVSVDHNCAPPRETWGIKELDKGEWVMMRTTYGDCVLGCDTLEELADEAVQELQFDAERAVMDANDARATLAKVQQHTSEATMRAERLAAAVAVVKGWGT